MVLLITGRKNRRYIPRVKKKTKAANCVFLTEDRICTNKKSHKYCEKCFEATYCTYRVKEKICENTNDNSDTTSIMKSYRQKGVWITHKTFGKGQVIEVNGQHITVLFDSGIKTEMSLKYCIKNKVIELFSTK